MVKKPEQSKNDLFKPPNLLARKRKNKKTMAVTKSTMDMSLHQPNSNPNNMFPINSMMLAPPISSNPNSSFNTQSNSGLNIFTNELCQPQDIFNVQIDFENLKKIFSFSTIEAEIDQFLNENKTHCDDLVRENSQSVQPNVVVEKIFVERTRDCVVVCDSVLTYQYSSGVPVSRLQNQNRNLKEIISLLQNRIMTKEKETVIAKQLPVKNTLLLVSTTPNYTYISSNSNCRTAASSKCQTSSSPSPDPNTNFNRQVSSIESSLKASSELIESVDRLKSEISLKSDTDLTKNILKTISQFNDLQTCQMSSYKKQNSSLKTIENIFLLKIEESLALVHSMKEKVTILESNNEVLVLYMVTTSEFTEQNIGDEQRTLHLQRNQPKIGK